MQTFKNKTVMTGNAFAGAAPVQAHAVALGVPPPL